MLNFGPSTLDPQLWHHRTLDIHLYKSKNLNITIILYKKCHSPFLYPRSLEGKGGILFYLCPSVRPSKKFFVAFFSATIDGRNLIFGHKLHIGMPYCGKRFWDPYILIFRRIFLSKYWWQKSDISSQASYRYPILWEAFLDPSDSYFLFTDLVGFYTPLTYMLIFRRIFLSNYWRQESDIWSQASYRYPISW
jgi:hypothetical protein